MGTRHPILANGEQQQRREVPLKPLDNPSTHMDSSTTTAVSCPTSHLSKCVHSTGGKQHVHGREQDVPSVIPRPTPILLVPGRFPARDHGVGGRPSYQGLLGLHSQPPHIRVAVRPLLNYSTAIHVNI